MQEYCLYHDESKEQGFWHAFLLVPVSFHDKFSSLLAESQKRNRLQQFKLSFKDLNKPSHYQCAKTWFTLLVASLQNSRPDLRVDYYWGRQHDKCGNKSGDYRRFDKIPGCKASLFYFPQGAKAFTYCSDYSGQFAAAFKIGAKGLMNYLLPKGHSCQINDVFIDGEKHFGKRGLPKDRLLKNLRAETKSHISVADDCRITGDCIPGNDRLILNAVDLFLGAFRYASKVIPENVSDQGIVCRMDISRQGNKLIDYLNRHPAGQRKGRFFRGITMREATINGGSFSFYDLSLRMLPSPKGEQGDFLSNDFKRLNE